MPNSMATSWKSLGRDTANRRVSEADPPAADGPGAVVTKRSLTIAGHRTSISLEDAFWCGLRDIAADRGLSVSALVAEVDRKRGPSNLSSALRVFVLAFSRSRLTR